MKISLWTRFLDVIAPRLCVVCGNRLSAVENTLCMVCYMHLPRSGRDNIPFEDNAMARMFWGLVPVERAAALFHYSPHSDTSKIIYEMKYHNRPDIGLDMGRMMARELMTEGFFDGIDYIVPVPLSAKRKRNRGYNQSDMLAKGVAEITNITIKDKLLLRKDFRGSQTMLSRWRRMENVKDVFLLKEEETLCDKHVLILDDVTTTGATMLACAEAMKHIEGIKISFLSLALTKN